MLPPLPDKLSSLNGITLKCLIRGILKDLRLSWRSVKPFGGLLTSPTRVSLQHHKDGRETGATSLEKLFITAMNIVILTQKHTSRWIQRTPTKGNACQRAYSPVTTIKLSSCSSTARPQEKFQDQWRVRREEEETFDFTSANQSTPCRREELMTPIAKIQPL